MDPKAVQSIQENCKKVNTDPNKFQVFQSECSQLLYKNMKMFNIIDLDPYGSAIPLLDSAIQSIQNNGLLCVTFTDMTVLCGKYQETALYKYGVIPYYTSFCHEMAKRIALYSISTCASRYQKIIIPLLSFNANFYIRMFLIVKDSAEGCKNNSTKYGYMFHCRNCQNRSIISMAQKIETQTSGQQNSRTDYKFNNLTGNEKCSVCDSFMCMSGPYWISDLHDEDFVDKLKFELNNGDRFTYLKYNNRINIMLNSIKEELPFKNEVFSYDYAQFSRDISLSSPKLSLFK
jgi:tRNA (guanine26-N2/guanine27-N2)-dimethyltransferase